MRTSITVRIKAGLLAAVRRNAAQDNRTLAKFIETELQHRTKEMAPDKPPSRHRRCQAAAGGSSDAA